MKKLCIALLASLWLAGCATQPDISHLSLDAQNALLQAQADVKQAKDKKADTDAASAELDKANDAARNGDNAAVIEHANVADKAALAAIKKAKHKKK